MINETVLIIDLNSPDPQSIAREIRKNNVYCEVRNKDYREDDLSNLNPKGIILSGDDIYQENGELNNIFHFIKKVNCPILTWETHFQTINSFFQNCRTKEEIELKDFLFSVCHCQGDWKISDFVDKSIQEIKAKVGNKKVICALSGGVDSSVAALMVHQAIGKQLTCVFVDTGLMRKNEGDQVCQIYREKFDMNLIRVNAEERFLKRLKGVSDPEQKRKIIGEEFIRVFEEEANKIGQVDFLVQGTIYPDIIESGAANNKMVKSHHNVGGIPERISFKAILEPLKELFKDEVRETGLYLGIPDDLVFRQPFPGPGLGIRIIGEITTEKLDILREADFIYREAIKKAGLDQEIWQYFAVLTNLKSVGMKDNERTYCYTLALRGVYSVDSMKAQWARIPFDILDSISQKITDEIPMINRVVYDITSKPPSTIEWE